MLTPVLALVIWTLIIWIWMYATRIPAMQKAKVDPQDAIHANSLSSLPSDVRVVADNYNHLHEQPTIFYALVIYLHLAGEANGLNIALAWGYVALRIMHSFVQIVPKIVMIRFILFSLSTVLLIGLALRGAFALVTG